MWLVPVPYGLTKKKEAKKLKEEILKQKIKRWAGLFIDKKSCVRDGLPYLPILILMQATSLHMIKNTR
ncbi:hypothetical protein ACA29_19700 [Lederbergia galactosidilytica]|uniref:Uncharacterized protein n=1 Tax=Lederbergia galactosidilytica TaxID=217031 RepID=A0A0Q9XS39_9BACI|nr:hypothetical protein ACA29_19700 [Lederbergia galactosidilytica]